MTNSISRWLYYVSSISTLSRLLACLLACLPLYFVRFSFCSHSNFGYYTLTLHRIQTIRSVLRVVLRWVSEWMSVLRALNGIEFDREGQHLSRSVCLCVPCCCCCWSTRRRVFPFINKIDANTTRFQFQIQTGDKQFGIRTPHAPLCACANFFILSLNYIFSNNRRKKDLCADLN